MKPKTNGLDGRPSRAAPTGLDEGWITLQALTFLAEDQEAAERFFLLTGLGPGTLRAAIGEPGFVPSILDFLIEDDERLERFALRAGCRPEDLVLTREKQRAGEDWGAEA